MDRTNLLLSFIGIVVGLGVADLLLSVHRLVRARRRWDWLPAAWALLTFGFVLVYWWVLAEIILDGGISTLSGFAFHLVTPVLLFLACAAALPDTADDDTPLATYYIGNRRYFFGLLAAYFVHGALDFGFNYGSWGRPAPWLSLCLALLMAVLAFSERRAVHGAITGVLLAAFAGFLLTINLL